MICPVALQSRRPGCKQSPPPSSTCSQHRGRPAGQRRAAEGIRTALCAAVRGGERLGACSPGSRAGRTGTTAGVRAASPTGRCRDAATRYDTTVTNRGPALRRDLWRGWGPIWPSLVLALAVAAVQIAGSHMAGRWQPDRKPLDGVAMALLVAGPLLLIGRHRFPVAALWATSGTALLFMLLGYPYGPVMLCVFVALYAAIMAGHRLAAWLAMGALYGSHFLLRWLLDLHPAPGLT